VIENIVLTIVFVIGVCVYLYNMREV